MKNRINHLLCLIVLSGISNALLAQEPLIVDTDFGDFPDDAIAMELLFNYQKEGKAEIKGIFSSLSTPSAAEELDGLKEWYDLTGITLGSASDGTVCTSLYRETLSRQADGSVTLIAIGLSTNLARLLDSQSDVYSDCGGKELIGKKIKRLVVMGGRFDGDMQAEYNVRRDVEAARKVFEEWPGEILVVPFEAGFQNRYDSEELLGRFPEGSRHPIKEALSRPSHAPRNRPAWDPLAVELALDPHGDRWLFSERGEVRIDDSGVTRFEIISDGKCRTIKSNSGSSRGTFRYLQLF